MYYLSTKAHKGPQQPTKADAGPRRWKTAQTTKRNGFFLLYILFFIFYITRQLTHTHPTPLWRGRQPQKPTKAPAANKGRRRPTKREEGPNDARRVVWAIGKFFFLGIFSKCTTYPQKPTKAHSSQQRPTQAHKDGKRPIHMYFFIMYFFLNLQLIHERKFHPIYS